MKKNQFLEVCQEYDEILAKEGFKIKHRDPYNYEYDMNHIRWMVNEIPNIIDDPCKIQKANRWLGFVQGVLWIKGYYTVEDLKNHTKSGKECNDNIDVKKTDSDFYWFEGGYKEIE